MSSRHSDRCDNRWDIRMIKGHPGELDVKATLKPSRPLASNDRWMLLVLVLFGIGLTIAALCEAPFTWDGAWYFFAMIDTGVPFIAHDRLIDAPLHTPVVWLENVTDSMNALRKTFSLLHVLTPLVSLALSWWIIRRDAPGLIIWPILGMGLALLPGQINFISEAIKAHQLIWPVLLAVLIGLPPRTVPVASMTALIIMLLHPAAALILGATAAAAFVLGWLVSSYRERLLPFSICLFIMAVLRYLMIISEYDSSGMGPSTLKRQFLNSATGLPGIALTMTFLAAGLLLVLPWLEHRFRWGTNLPLASVAIAVAVLVVWALDPTLWWDALEFRGPAHFVSLAMAGLAFLDAISHRFPGRETSIDLASVRRRCGQAIAMGFAIVIGLQSYMFGQEIDGMRSAMAASDKRCIEISDLPNMPNSPLNLWSTPSHSLLYQGWTPDRIVLPDGGCDLAAETGILSVTRLHSPYYSTNVDLVPLQWSLSPQTGCWWDEPEGWHPVEDAPEGRRRWSPDIGTFRVFSPTETSAVIHGTLDSFPEPNVITIRVNGAEQHRIEMTDSMVDLAQYPLELERGENLIELVSEQPSGNAQNDSRDLALAVLSAQPELADGQSCSLIP